MGIGAGGGDCEGGDGGMTCPKCGGETGVYETRPTTFNRFRRRRKCLDCGFRFTTYEEAKNKELDAEAIREKWIAAINKAVEELNRSLWEEMEQQLGVKVLVAEKKEDA